AQMQADGHVEQPEPGAVTLGGVSLTRVKLNVKEDVEKVEAVLGENPVMLFGAGPKTAYFALGTNPQEALERAIAESVELASEKAPMFQASVALGAIVKMMAQNAPDNPVLADLAESIDPEKPGVVSIRSMSIPNGARIRFQIDKGVIRVAGGLGEAFNPGGNRPPEVDNDF